jgi:hypothetical protein
VPHELYLAPSGIIIRPHITMLEKENSMANIMSSSQFVLSPPIPDPVEIIGALGAISKISDCKSLFTE